VGWASEDAASISGGVPCLLGDLDSLPGISIRIHQGVSPLPRRAFSLPPGDSSLSDGEVSLPRRLACLRDDLRSIPDGLAWGDAGMGEGWGDDLKQYHGLPARAWFGHGLEARDTRAKRREHRPRGDFGRGLG
jgi:hypothetical protein